MKSLLEDRVRKSRMPAKLDLVQSLSGLALALFMWVHLLLVSSILISKDAMLFVTRMMEGSLAPSKEAGYPILVKVAVGAVFFLFVLHAALAMRKFPANWKQWRTMRSHVKMMKHGDTTNWWLQAITGFIMFFLGSAHLMIMWANHDRIGPYLSSERFVHYGLWPMYIVLLFAVELHGAIGLYRLAVKWGLLDGKDPEHTRKRLKKAKWAISVFFIGLGLATFASYVKIGLERQREGKVGIPYAVERDGSAHGESD